MFAPPSAAMRAVQDGSPSRVAELSILARLCGGPVGNAARHVLRGSCLRLALPSLDRWAFHRCCAKRQAEGCVVQPADYLIRFLEPRRRLPGARPRHSPLPGIRLALRAPFRGWMREPVALIPQGPRHALFCCSNGHRCPELVHLLVSPPTPSSRALLVQPPQ